MKMWLRSALLLLSIAIVAAGCSLINANEPDGKPNSQEPGQVEDGSNGAEPTDENNVSPVPDEAPETLKETVILYFADRDLMDMFRVKKEIEVDSEEYLPKAALETWLKGPEQEDLANLVPPEVVIEKVELKDGIAYVSFSKEIRNANLGSGGEMFLIEQITLIMKQFGYNSTQILVEGQAEESILGHVTTNEPIPASDPEQYQWYE